jgi:CelD/BcsL family acetyltransferase involved in cellulose biosynthesis
MVALSRSAPLTLEVIATPERLFQLEPEWDELLGRSEQDEPTSSPLWLRAWWRRFGQLGGRQLCALSLRQGPRLVGLAPLARRWAMSRPAIPLRRIELLPSGEPEADEICSDYIGVVAERGYEQRVADLVAESAAAGALGTWDELVMPAMRMGGVMPPLLAAAFERVGAVKLTPSGGAPYIPLPATWDEYLAALSGSRRRLVRRSLAAFDAWTGGHASFEVARTGAELRQGMEILETLHAARWRADGRPGVFASARFRGFHDEVMPALLGRGALELCWLSAHGEPVAALYNIVWNDRVLFYQSGRRPDLPRDVRVGVVIHALAIRRAIELGRREYDFLAGASRYKEELALATRPLARLTVVRARRRARARALFERGASLVRSARAARARDRSRTDGSPGSPS